MSCLVSATLLALLLPAGARPASAPSLLRRFALVVGANRGAADRVPLRYAVADAERFAELVGRMGGVQAEDSLLLRDPTREALLEALAVTSARTGSARAETQRVEVILYFSGHADDQGLMLGRELLPYRELRDAVHAIRADVGITILDACASGAITRLKGGRTHPAFLSDGSNEVQGYAFLTSSSENEAAQESERLRGSFFTHALLTGLRGAADVSDDGKVTLNEAYQFAFQETLVQTTTTQAGAQHPAYDIRMAGRGDVVMTDVRQTSSSLILGEDYDGRFLVLNGQRHLVAELYKPYGRRVELGLEPGDYEVYFEQDKRLLTSSLKVAAGERRELARDALQPTRRLPIQVRGEDGAGPPDLLDGRVRVQAGYGTRFTFSHWLAPSLALQLTFGGREFGASDRTVLLGARYYPSISGRVRPHLGGAVGSFGVLRYQLRPMPGGGLAYEPTESGNEVGIGLGAGVDLYLGRKLSLSLDSQASLAGDRWSIDTWVSIGWTFGGRRRP
jgi:hypothetical protein